jgi:uncharacterized membrane-anchored protein
MAFFRVVLLPLLLLIGSFPLHAKEAGPAKGGAAEPAPNELDAAFEAARAVIKQGPAEVKLGNQAALKLPEGYVFVPPKEGGRILSAMGNRPGENLLGLVFPSDDNNWFLVARFEKSGYIKDDDAKDWDADELLASVQEGTAEVNAERRARGIPEVEVVGWVEKPTYDPSQHQLVWSLSSKEKGAPTSAEQTINYKTLALGREGYVSMNLVADLGAIEGLKPVAKNLLAGLHFNDGKRYADFDETTDEVATYGLAALVGGVAAKKLGLFALIGVFFAKFGKLIVLAAAGALGVGAKLWKRKKGEATVQA